MLTSIHARLRVVTSWSCLLVLFCSSVPRIASAQPAGDDAALRKLVEKFFDLYQKEDMEGMMALWSEKSPEFVARKAWFQKSFAANRFQLRGLTISKIEVSEVKAKIRAVVNINAEDASTGKAIDGFGIVNRTFYTLREGEEWKIWQYVISERDLAAALASAKTDEERRAILAGEKELMTAELVHELVSEGNRLQSQGASSASLDIHRLALSLAEQLRDRVGAANVLRSLGNIHRWQGNNTEALEHLQKSLRIREEIGDMPGMAATLYEIGNIQYAQGDYSQALEHLQKSLKISEEMGGKRNKAMALNNIGLVYYAQGNYSLSLEHHKKSLKISEEVGDKGWIGSELNNIGNVLYDQGNYTEALEHFQKSLIIGEEVGDKQAMAVAQHNIGNVHYARGSYSQALEYYQKSLKVSEEAGLKGAIATALNNTGNVHQAQGNFTEALNYLQKSLRIQEELGDKGAITNVLNNIGNVHYARGNYTQALEHYQKSLKVSEEIALKGAMATALNNIGNVHYAQGNYTEALEHYRKSLRIKEEISDKGAIAIALNNIGNVYHEQGNYSLALEHLQKSLKVSEEIALKGWIALALYSIGNVHYEQGKFTEALEHLQRSLRIKEEIGDRPGIANTLYSIGNVHYAQGNYSLAREELTKSIAAVEELRDRVAGDEQQQQQFFQTMLSPYHRMITLSVDEKKYTDAFAFAERVKGRALLDTLEAGRVDVTKAMTDDERAEEQRLNAEAVSLNTRIYRENLRNQPDKAVLMELQARRDKARASYEAFQINLYAAHPELKILRGGMTPISLAEAGKLIPNAGTAIVQYVVTKDFTYLFVLTKAEQAQAYLESPASAPILKVYTIKIKQKELADRVGRFHGRLSQKDIDFSASSRELYDLLIGPARADLKNKTNLIVVPDGALWQVPFQALQPSANRFLIQDYAISYAPSLTVLHEMMNVKQKRQPNYSKLSTLIAFGNPDVDLTTAANLKTAYPEVLADEKLLPLPQTEVMVKTLSRLYGPDRSKIYVRAEASEEQAKKEASACRILQFATHGILDNTNPMYSRLVMSQSGVGKQEDGMLEAWEIMKLDIQAEMVILSACDTAQGRVAGGEGMIGLAWAFFVAGCPTTVVSQWKVEVNSTVELMVEFHKGLKPGIEGQSSGVSKAEALRAAVLKLMKSPRYRHPFYWAPFVVIGDAR